MNPKGIGGFTKSDRDYEKEVLEAVKANPNGLTTREVSDKVQMDNRWAYEQLLRLREKRLVIETAAPRPHTRSGPRKLALWVPNIELAPGVRPSPGLVDAARRNFQV